MEGSKADVSIVVVPIPAQGHLNQLLHLSIILSNHGLTVHYAAPTAHINQAKSRLEGWPMSAMDSIRFHDLPIPSFASPAPNPESFPSHLQPLFEAFQDTQVHFANLLQFLSSTSRRVVVISDPLASFALREAAALPNGEPYTFGPVPPSLGLAWYGHNNPASELLKSLGLTLSVEDCITEEFNSLMIRSQNKPQSGLLINNCRVIEGEFLDFYRQQPELIGRNSGECIFAIGPLNPTVLTETTGPRHHCLDWLNNQPPRSVIYISFGTTTSISDGQMEQLAIGLLNSKQRFIWVLREADRGDGVVDRKNDQQKKLPLGFMEKIEGKGIIIGDWAPQLQILSNKATACFMSHCGWNSCMESISMGVPLLAWPMHSDQPWNSIVVSSYLKVGVIVRDWARRREVLPAAEIEKAIKEVMVYNKGEEIKWRATELRDAVRQAVADGGSSHRDLLSFINHITRS